MEEIWKDIVGYEGLYQVSNIGRVKSFGNKSNHRNEIILKQAHRKGYCFVVLYKNYTKEMKSIHRLVGEGFIFNLDSKPEINHKDGNKSNNNIDNLEWVTRKENSIHSYSIGLQKRGSSIGTSKLTESQVYRIKWIAKYTNLKRGYWTQLSNALNISRETIYNIIYNKGNWFHIIV